LGWYYLELADKCPDLAPGLKHKIQTCESWIEARAGNDLNLPEQVAENLNVPSYNSIWVKRWGEVASPLLWSHAKYIILCSWKAHVLG
jgi:GH15 family glucan-1,4-alpha-glucosidase